MTCPWCLGNSLEAFSKDERRSYLVCLDCSLVFVPRSELISPEKEKLRYDAHENGLQNEDYKKYLGKVVSQLSSYLSPGMRGLDFGSGPSLILSELFRHQGIEVESFDLFYHNDQRVFEKSYDFIVMSEVIEHLREPRLELERLRRCLKPQGLLFIKTCLCPQSVNEFEKWFYKRDVTHVQFFSKDTFYVLGKELSLAEAEDIGTDLFLLRDNT
jgi:cyclopropane fatty-acyl-phospholipid synthase-like methyltransferase